MAEKPVAGMPVIHVSNLETALEYYKTVLGCTVEFEYGGFYAGITFGKSEFHLSQGEGMFKRPVGGANVYFFMTSVADVDLFYEEIVANGGKTNAPPNNYPYGMRDFVAFDPDGNMLSFGASTEE